jgi:tRNA splicing endonuclease
MSENIEKKIKRKIVVHDHKGLKLETNSLIRKTLNIFIIPFLNSIPVKSRSLVKKSHKAVNDIVDNATTHKALEILYSNGNKSSVKKLYEKISHAVWFNTNNSKGVRNRLKIVKNQVSEIFKEKSKGSGPINLVSIAAGSARAVIEALEDNPTDNEVNVYFVDKSNHALDYSKDLLKEMRSLNNQNYKFTWINDTVNGFLDNNEVKFDIVEMVGLMDYFNDEKAKNIFTKIYNSLNDSGYFITANINHNSEKKFVTKAIGWPMVYRSAEHLARLVHEAGFPHTDMSVYYEPLKIHSIIIAKR